MRTGVTVKSIKRRNWFRSEFRIDFEPCDRQPSASERLMDWSWESFFVAPSFVVFFSFSFISARLDFNRAPLYLFPPFHQSHSGQSDTKPTLTNELRTPSKRIPLFFSSVFSLFPFFQLPPFKVENVKVEKGRSDVHWSFHHFHRPWGGGRLRISTAVDGNASHQRALCYCEFRSWMEN